MSETVHAKIGMVAGIDVSKAELVVAFRRLDGVVRELTVANNPAGHKQLVELFAGRQRPSRVVIEPTSTFHADLAFALTDAGVAVMLVNPLAARRFAEAQMRRAKTDRVDARVLLEFGLRMEFERWSPPSPAARELRAVARHLSGLVAERTALVNQLAAAKATRSTPQFVLDDLASAIQKLDERIAACEAEGLRIVRADASLARRHAALVTIKGIADRSALLLAGELVVLDPKMTPDEVVAHAGLDPRPRQSGTLKGVRRTSKVGNARLRAALHMPAVTAARWSPPVKAWHDALAARKPGLVAITAVARRLLRVVWVIFQRCEPWDPAKFAPRPPKAPGTTATPAENCGASP